MARSRFRVPARLRDRGFERGRHRQDVLWGTATACRPARGFPHRKGYQIADASRKAGTLRQGVGYPDSPAFNSWGPRQIWHKLAQRRSRDMSFYVVLPSGSNETEFSDNARAAYRTRLAHRLDGERIGSRSRGHHLPEFVGERNGGTRMAFRNVGRWLVILAIRLDSNDSHYDAR